MTTKQRYQSPLLTDDLRLQSFVYANALVARAKCVAKIEIWAENPALVSMRNPRGLSLVQTVVSHFGQPSREIYGWPTDDSPEYWETILNLDPDIYGIGKYHDRWYYILDPDYDILWPQPAPRYSPLGYLAPSGNYRGIQSQMDRGEVIVHFDPSLVDVSLLSTLRVYAITGGWVSTPFSQPTGAYWHQMSAQFEGTQIEDASGSPALWLDTEPLYMWLTAKDADTNKIIGRTAWNIYNMPLTANREIIPNGLTNGSSAISGLDLDTAVAAAHCESSYNAFGNHASYTPDSPQPVPLVDGFFSDPSTAIGVLISGEVMGPGDHGWAHYLKLATTDGLAWSGQAASPYVDPWMLPDHIEGQMDRALGVLQVRMHHASPFWNDGPQENYIPAGSICLWFADQWRISGLEYDPSQPLNPWDSLWSRTAESLRVDVEHDFSVHHEQWFASPRPIVTDWSFDVEPVDVYVNTLTYMRVNVRPIIPLNPELQRYQYEMLAASQMTYRVYEGGMVEGSAIRLISSGEVWWHEEQQGLIRLDTRVSPLNREIQGFIVMQVTLPDGGQTRSGKIFLRIRDDLRLATQRRSVLF